MKRGTATNWGRIAAGTALLCAAAWGQGVPTREYIYLGDRLVAVESVSGTPVAPVLGAVTPANSTVTPDVETTYTITMSDANGWQNLQSIEMLTAIKTAFGHQSCYALYRPVDDTVALAVDAGTGWGAPTAMGTTELSNGQCRIVLSGSSAQRSGTTVTLNLRIAYKAVFAGAFKIFVRGTDAEGLTTTGGFLETTAVTVAGNLAPQAVYASVTPTSGPNTTLQVKFDDPNGWQNQRSIFLAIEDAPYALTPAPGCFMTYVRAKGEIWLSSDAGTWQNTTPVTQGAGMAENSRCKVTGSGFTAVGSGNQLTLTIPLEFKTAHAGQRKVWVNVHDIGGLDPTGTPHGTAAYPGWVVANNMMVNGTAVNGFYVHFSASPGIGGVYPMNMTLTPSGNSTPVQNFELEFTDPDGYQNLTTLGSLTAITVWGHQSCYVVYTPQNNLLYLTDGSWPMWQAARTLPLAADYSNDQCTLHAGSSYTGVGTSLKLNLSVSFKKEYAGTFGWYLFGQDEQGNTAGWAEKTKVTVAGNVTPATTVASTSTANGSATTLTVTFRDDNGAKNLRSLFFAVANAAELAPGPACRMTYVRGFDQLWLSTDGAGWNSGAALFGGTTGMWAENSACKVSQFVRTIDEGAKTISITVYLEFKSGYAGTKKIYATPHDIGGANPGGAALGTAAYPAYQEFGQYVVSFAPVTVTVSPSSAAMVAGGQMTFTSSAPNAVWTLEGVNLNWVTVSNTGVVSVAVPPGNPSVFQVKATVGGVTGSATVYAYFAPMNDTTHVSPVSGVGSRSQFLFWRPNSDASNPATQFEYMLYNATETSAANACYMVFAYGALYLANDEGTAFVSSMTLRNGQAMTNPPATTESIGNTQCTAHKQFGYTYTGQFDTFWNVDVEFKPVFSGDRHIFVRSGNTTEPSGEAYKRIGSWRVP